jgi:hypothetical protein
MERYASTYAFVKNFMKCDSISTIRQIAVVRWRRTNAARRVVDTISIVSCCVHPDSAVGIDNL